MRKQMCRSGYRDSHGNVIAVCTLRKGHYFDHHAYDASTDIRWSDEIDELAERRAVGKTT